MELWDLRYRAGRWARRPTGLAAGGSLGPGRSTAPFRTTDIRTPPGPSARRLATEHRALHDNGAVHLLATLDGHDVGLLTIELTSPVPHLCPDGQPYIGPIATLPSARGQGAGRGHVDAALSWAYAHGYQ